MNNKIKYFGFALSLILWAGCEELSLEDIENNSMDYFEEGIWVENPSEDYQISDTIWITGEMPDSLTSLETLETVALENATFMFSGELFLLYTENDSVSFLEKNFSVLVSQGELELLNVLEDNEVKFQIDIKYGKPDATNKFRFALIPKFEGIFAFKAISNVYYGHERDNLEDMSWENKKGLIYHDFEDQNINEEAYEQIPLEAKQYFEHKFGTSFITEKEYYFFNVTAE